MNVLAVAGSKTDDNRTGMEGNPIMTRQRLGTMVGLLVATAMLAGCASGGTPTGSASTVPSTVAPVAVTALTQTYTSALYGYSIKYPVTFSPTTATTKLKGAAVPVMDGGGVDLLSGSTAVVVMAAPEIEPGTKLERWTADTATGFCGAASATEAVQAGGLPAIMSTFGSCKGLFHLWVTAVGPGGGYHVIWTNQRGSEAADRDLFLKMLATFAIEPE
jgi:hypothetical protein